MAPQKVNSPSVESSSLSPSLFLAQNLFLLQPAGSTAYLMMVKTGMENLEVKHSRSQSKTARWLSERARHKGHMLRDSVYMKSPD